jgi:glutamate carboxypeptidase
MRPDFNAIFTARLDEMADLTAELVAAESPTTDKQAVDRLSRRMASELADLDAQVRIHPRAEVGDIVEARWHADQPGAPLLILCHIDTVHPLGALAINPLRRERGRLYGPGSSDMKGSVAIVLTVLRALRDLDLFPQRPIAVLLTTDEETGSFHSRTLIQQLAGGAGLVMVMEAALPDGSLKTWRKGVARFTVQTHGNSAHAGGAHEFGVNAIEEMAHQVLAIQALTDYEAGTTVSVGIVEGGTRTNVIPDVCEAQVDVRAILPGEMERLIDAFNHLQPVLDGAGVTVEGGFDRPPMLRDERMSHTFTQAQAIASHYGLTLTESGTGGASDGNYTAAMGTPTLDGLGPLGDGAHTDREYLDIGSMVKSATLIAALLLEWPGN